MPYGTLGLDLLQNSNGQSASSLPPGFRNRIINGAMMIDQRNSGSSVTPTNGAYTLDRWSANLTQASKFTVQQSSTAPTGFTNSLKVTSSSAYSVVSGDYFAILQAIEGMNVADTSFGTANAKTLTLSFQVYSSLTGTFGGALRNYNADRSYPFNYTISSANTWTTISVTIPGDTTGTWSLGTTTGSMFVIFSLGAGATLSGTANSWQAGNYIQPSGSTSVVGVNGATWYVTGVQLEVGSTATTFDLRDYGRELIMCQRYYWRKSSGGTSATIDFIAVQQVYSTSATFGFMFNYPTIMRTTPTIAVSSAAHFNCWTAGGSPAQAFTGVGAWYADTMGFAQYGGLTGSTGLTAGNVTNLYFNNASGWIDASAEL